MFPYVIKRVVGALDLATVMPASGIANVLRAQRMTQLQQFSGEFAASGLVGSILRCIPRGGSYRDVLGGLTEIRNTCHYTAYAMRRLSETTRKSVAERPEALANIMAGTYDDYAKVKAPLHKSVNRALALELVMSPFGGADDFVIVTPGMQADSYARWITELYVATATPEGRAGGRPEVTGVLLTDSKGTVTDGSKAVSDYLLGLPSTELAQIRVIDWVLTMFHSPMFWHSLFPADKTADIQQMTIRRAGVLQLAGICHALIIADTIMASTLVKDNHARLEKWIGTLPIAFKRGFDPYKEYVTTSDPLGLIADASAMLDIYDGTGGPNGLTTTVLLDDIEKLEAWDVVKDAVNKASAAALAIGDITDLQQLRETTVHPVIAMAPVAEAPAIRELPQQLRLSENYHLLMSALAGALSSNTLEFLPKDNVQNIKALGLKPLMLIQGKYPVFAQGAKAYKAGVSDGTLSLPINAIQGDSATSSLINERHILSFVPLSELVNAYQSGFGINDDVAHRLRLQFGGERWTSLYPVQYASTADGLVYTSRFADGLSILDQLSRMCHKPQAVLKADLAHWTFRRLLATHASSWLQLVELKGTSVDALSAQARRSLPGLDPGCKPYGLEAREWNELFKGADLIELIPGTLAARVIKRLAVPTDQLLGTIVNNELYYNYYKGVVTPGNGDRSFERPKNQGMRDITLTVEGYKVGARKDGIIALGTDLSMRHFAAFPIPSQWARAVALYDGRYFYSADAVVGCLDAPQDASIGTLDVGKVGLKKLVWPGHADSQITTLYGTGAELNLPSVVEAGPGAAEAMANKGTVIKTAKAREEAQRARAQELQSNPSGSTTKEVAERVMQTKH